MFEKSVQAISLSLVKNLKSKSKEKNGDDNSPYKNRTSDGLKKVQKMQNTGICYISYLFDAQKGTIFVR